MTIDRAPTRRRLPRLATLFARPRRISCQELVELVTAYLEGALDPPTRMRIESHLRRCDGCATYLEELRSTITSLGGLTPEGLNPVFRARLMVAFTDGPARGE